MAGRIGLTLAVAGAVVTMDFFSVPYVAIASVLPVLASIAYVGYYTRE